nr:membrane protein insertion efficiency factor YidD [Parabacteroides sp. FAFU027]
MPKVSYSTNDSNKKESAVSDYIGLYQKYISGTRGTKCLMYPSCSNYGLMAFKENGFFEGITLTAERLLRCGHEVRNYDKIYFGDEFRLVDFPSGTNLPANLNNLQSNSQIFAFSGNSINRDSSLLFIRYMINTEQYNIALLEIERLLFAKKYKGCAELYLNKLICLRNLNQEELALFTYENRFPDDIKSNPDILYQISLIQYKLFNFKMSDYYNNQINDITDSSLIEKKYLLKGVINAQYGDWSQAAEYFSTGNKYKYNPERYKTNINIAQTGAKLKQKSPLIASLLSIIPGMGYAYAGHYQTATTSLITNTALAYAVYTSIKTKNYGIAILTGSLNFGFYIGNIIGGSSSVKREYRRKKQQIISTLENVNNINH